MYWIRFFFENCRVEGVKGIELKLRWIEFLFVGNWEEELREKADKQW